jgi:hypothetical protein
MEFQSTQDYFNLHLNSASCLFTKENSPIKSYVSICLKLLKNVYLFLLNHSDLVVDPNNTLRRVFLVDLYNKKLPIIVYSVYLVIQ